MQTTPLERKAVAWIVAIMCASSFCVGVSLTLLITSSTPN